MLGYLLFLIPTLITFVVIGLRSGIEQALLDLIAFHLLFAFDFAAILPGNISVYLLHLILIAFIGYQFLLLMQRPVIRVSQRALLVIGATTIIAIWIVVALLINHLGTPRFFNAVNSVVRNFLLNILLIFVGLRLAKGDRLERFAKIFLAAALVVSIICIVQTISGGVVLGNDERSVNYLGIFQPLGDKALAKKALLDASIGYIDYVRTIRFGHFRFYRAPGTYEGVTILLCCVAVGVLALLTYRKSSAWLPLVLALLAVGFFAGFQRTTIAVFLGSVVFVLFIRFKALLSLRFILSIATIVTIIFTSVLFIEPVNNAVAATIDGFLGERGSREVSSLNGRSSLWGYVMTQIAWHPVFGTTEPITLLRAGWGNDDNPDADIGAHNVYLEFAYRAGIVPALLLISLFSFALLRSFRLSRNKRLPLFQRSIFFAIFGSLVALTICNMSGFTMQATGVAALFWIPCGYLAVYQLPDPKNSFVASSNP